MRGWKTAEAGWKRGLFWSVWILAAFALGTIPFWIWPLDLAISAPFYRPEDGWFLRYAPGWQFLYRFGPLPAGLLALSALIVFLGGWPVPGWRRFRKIAAYLLLSLAVGPGLLINLCFKDHWGRPRPRSVEELGGRYPHERVWTMDPASPGKSFPCGHCSMGFYFFSLALLLGWRSRKGLLVGAGAAAFGALVGMGRIVQGGHFASDVWWAAGFSLLSCVLLFCTLSLDRDLWYRGRSTARQALPLWVMILSGAVLTVLVLAILLATPYRSDQTHPLSVTPDHAFRVRLVLEGDRHELRSGNSLEVREWGRGHGLPGSAVKSELYEWPGEKEWRGQAADSFLFRQRRSGWLKEVDQETEIVIPGGTKGEVEVEVRSGELWIGPGLPEADQEWRLIFPSGSGRIHLEGLSAEELEQKASLRIVVEGAEWADGRNGVSRE